VNPGGRFVRKRFVNPGGKFVRNRFVSPGGRLVRKRFVNVNPGGGPVRNGFVSPGAGGGTVCAESVPVNATASTMLILRLFILLRNHFQATVMPLLLAEGYGLMAMQPARRTRREHCIPRQASSKGNHVVEERLPTRPEVNPTRFCSYPPSEAPTQQFVGVCITCVGRRECLRRILQSPFR
jgi:hypothetical protein